MRGLDAAWSMPTQEYLGMNSHHLVSKKEEEMSWISINYKY